MRRVTIVFGLCLALATSFLAIGPQRAEAASVTSTCTATKTTTMYGISAGMISAKVSITLNYSVSGNYVTLKSVGYQFYDASYQPLVPPGPPLGAQISGNGNINFKGSVVSLNSPDSMGTAGTWDFADLKVFKGTQLQIQGIPDIRNISDPSCSVYINV